MRYITRISSIAIATIVLVAMVAAAGVSAAKPATVGAMITGAPSVCYDNVVGNMWGVVQGVADTHGNTVYYTNNGVNWVPIGTGTNPCMVWLGAGNAFAIFARGTDGALWEKTTTDATNWKTVSLPATSVLAGTGPAATWTAATGETDVFYVNSGSQNLMWLSLPTTDNPAVTNLHGVVFATPAATTTSTGGMNVVVKGTGGVIYEKMYAMGGWSGWTKFHDGLIGAGASLVGAGTGNLYLFVSGTNSQLYAAWSHDDGLTWVTNYQQKLVSFNTNSIYWAPLGGITQSAPSATFRGSNPPVCMVRGGDGSIWYETLKVPTSPPSLIINAGWTGPITGP